jgi:natural product biosynthesis luciferase-like monooxygenase protein
MDFSIMFWGVASERSMPDQYKYLLDACRFADENDFKAIWIPERHFHPFGGLFPNPSVICAALATVTSKIRLRAGSVVAPLHHPLRIAEEWSVVDNLSNGRVEIAFATGWKDDDFALAPNNFETRRSILVNTIETVHALWRGERIEAVNGRHDPIKVPIYPLPIQPELPTWITSAGSLKSITRAGRGGFNLLTHLLGQDYDELSKKINQYYAYRSSAGFTTQGAISLMLHTFVGQDINQVRETVRKPLSKYLLHSADLAIHVNDKPQWESADIGLKEEMIDKAFDQYFDTSALMGTPSSCIPLIKRLKTMGVTEVCCLIDFGLAPEEIYKGMTALAELKNACKNI